MKTFPAASHSRRRWLLVWLVISQLGALLSLGVWALSIGFAFLSFKNGASAGAFLLAGVIWGYPLFPAACAGFSWAAYRQGKNRRAAVVTALPLLPPLAYLAWVFSSQLFTPA